MIIDLSKNEFQFEHPIHSQNLADIFNDAKISQYSRDTAFQDVVAKFHNVPRAFPIINEFKLDLLNLC
jgi:hypothetical protein